jgi:hypothetical protein
METIGSFDDFGGVLARENSDKDETPKPRMNRMLHDQLEDDNYEANLTDGNNGQNDG